MGTRMTNLRNMGMLMIIMDMHMITKLDMDMLMTMMYMTVDMKIGDSKDLLKVWSVYQIHFDICFCLCCKLHVFLWFTRPKWHQYAVD